MSSLTCDKRNKQREGGKQGEGKTQRERICNCIHLVGKVLFEMGFEGNGGGGGAFHPPGGRQFQAYVAAEEKGQSLFRERQIAEGTGGEGQGQSQDGEQVDKTTSRVLYVRRELAGGKEKLLGTGLEMLAYPQTRAGYPQGLTFPLASH